MRDEVYSLGISLEYIDGSESDVYHIPGREKRVTIDPAGVGDFGLTGASFLDWDSELLSSGDPNNPTGGTPERWTIYNTAYRTVGTLGGLTTEGELGYWESTEDYPTGYDLPVGKIRHHRLPSAVNEPIFTKLGSTDNDLTYSLYKRKLTINFENIDIPASISSLVKRVKFHFTPRDKEQNKSVVGKGAFINCVTSD